eukprot:EG_transcript_10894
MALSPPLAGCISRQLTFSITNRLHPDRPPITDDFLQRVLSGDVPVHAASSTALSDHIGLSHMVTAAEAHDMVLQLTQAGDIVTFEVSFDTVVVGAEDAQPEPHRNLSFPSDCSEEVPDGLHVLCVEDSSIARRVLNLNLTKYMHANVKTFGEMEEELEDFVQETLRVADIAILDQHLQYGSSLQYGTDLVVRLLQGGFRGLICLRSANCEEEDVLAYHRSGAHFVVGKDVSGREFVKKLKVAYLAHLGRPCSSVVPCSDSCGSRLSIRSTAPSSSLELRSLLPH